ncbi:MAG: MarR family winged helix-turn-helix transcriptional regulator [Hyphomicrobiales bacterium]
MSDALPDFDLERYLPYRFVVLAARLSSKLAKQYKKEFGISIPEWRVLLNVGYTKDLSIRDIEQRVSLERSKVSRAATKLEAKGYLAKQIDSRDKRLLKLTLTPEGIELLSKLIPIAEAFQAELNLILGDDKDALQLALDRLMEETN